MPSRALGRLLAGALSLLLVGCAEIPTSGPVRFGDEVQAPAEDPLIRVLAQPPQPGMTPEEVVEGFLAASASFVGDHAVAREYLTERAQGRWDPSSGVQVFSGEELTLTLVRETPAYEAAVVRFAAPMVSALDADGAITRSSDEQLQLRLRLRQQGDEWRIATPPDGLLLTAPDVARSFRLFSLYFLDRSASTLVPDPVYVPIARPGAATTLVRSLLEGPTPWLAPAVRTGLPEGTQLVVDAVPIENGEARVDLSADVLKTDETERAGLAAQLVWTLSQLPEVTAVRITVEGTPLELPQAPVRQTTGTWSSYDPDVMPPAATVHLVQDGAVVAWAEAGEAPVPGVLGSGAVPVRTPATTRTGDLVAAVSVEGNAVYLERRFAPSEELGPTWTGQDLAAPSFDGAGTLWFVDRAEVGSRVWTATLDDAGEAAVTRVLAPGLTERRVLTLRLAHDGTRAALLVERRDGTGQLLLARVRADADRLRLDGLRRVTAAPALRDVRSVAWADAAHLVVLPRAKQAILGPVMVGVEGTVQESMGVLSGALSVTAAPDRPLLAQTSAGVVWRDSPVGWRRLAVGTDPAYPG